MSMLEIFNYNSICHSSFGPSGPSIKPNFTDDHKLPLYHAYPKLIIGFYKQAAVKHDKLHGMFETWKRDHYSVSKCLAPSSSDTVPHGRRIETSNALLQKPKNSHCRTELKKRVPHQIRNFSNLTVFYSTQILLYHCFVFCLKPCSSNIWT